jgi:hypothetical protein
MGGEIILTMPCISVIISLVILQNIQQLEGMEMICTAHG